MSLSAEPNIVVLIHDLSREARAPPADVAVVAQVEARPIRVVIDRKMFPTNADLRNVEREVAVLKSRPYVRRADRRGAMTLHSTDSATTPPSFPIDTCVGCNCGQAALDLIPTAPGARGAVLQTLPPFRKCCTDSAREQTLGSCRCITESKALLAKRVGGLALALADLPNYDEHGRLAHMARASRPLFECSGRCACASHPWMCGNRVVQAADGINPALTLEVRCCGGKGSGSDKAAAEGSRAGPVVWLARLWRL